MHRSKLVELIKTFNTKELREFKEYLASPFFNKNTELLMFFEYLKKQAPEFKEKKVERAKVYKALFNKPLDEKHLSYLMSFTLKHAEHYLGYVQYSKYEIREQYHILKALLDRGLDKHYNLIYPKTKKKLNDIKVKDQNYYYHQYLVSDIEYENFLKQNIRRYDERLQEAAGHFDKYFMLHKLRYSVEMLSRTSVINAEYKIDLLEEIMSFLGKELPLQIPQLAIYYEILLALKKDDNSQHFENLKALLNENVNVLPNEELKPMYIYAVNHCIRKVNSGSTEFLAELFNLYSVAIEKEIMFEDNYLSPWAFKNQVGVGLRLKNYDEVERFIIKYSKKLKPSDRDNAYNFNMAELNYYRREYDKALYFSNMVEFSDIYYSIDTKKMVMKIYYEKDEIEPLMSLIQSFKVFMRRNKLVSQRYKNMYFNFINIVSQLIKGTADNKEEIINNIKGEEVLADRKWLLEMADKL